MLKTKKYILMIIFASGTLACSDLLEKKDLTGVPEELIWNNDKVAQLYLNATYDLVMPTFPNMRGAGTLPTDRSNVDDETQTGDTRVLLGTLALDNMHDFSADSKKNTWFFLRRVNIMINDIHKGDLNEDAIARITGPAYFLRAWIYFCNVRLYGGIPIITRTQNWEDDDLYVKRATTRETFEFIVSDLDKAISLLQPGLVADQGPAGRGTLTQDAALAFKGRVLLFWASPQFNPNNDVQRWTDAYNANKEAYETLLSHGYALYPSYKNLFTEEGGGNKEPIIIRSFDGSIKPNSYERACRPVSETDNGGGSFFPTWEMVKAFNMADGTPSVDENGHAINGFDTVYYWKNREPRFYDLIAYNGAIWPLSGKTDRVQWTYRNVKEDKSRQTATGFYSKKFVNEKTFADNASQGTSDWIEMRFAEVMMNYAECANAVGKPLEAYDMLKQIRARSGLEPGTDDLYGLQANMNQNEMFKAIMHERHIEFAFEGRRHDDLRRNRLFEELNGGRRHGLYINVKPPFKADSLEKVDKNGVMLRDKLDLDGPDYTTYFSPQLVDIDSKDIFFDPDKYYFYAIPQKNLDANPNLLQTLGWGPEGDDKFDPLAE